MKTFSRGNVIYLVVTLIGILLLTAIIFTRYNNKTIKENKELQGETQTIKIYYDQIGKLIIHALDLGLRGYAIVRDDRLARPMYNAAAWKDSILNNVEMPLKRQGYNTEEFDEFKDSLNSYIRYCFHLKKLIDDGNQKDFLKLFTQDKGGHLWWQYVKCEKSILDFEGLINSEAHAKYEAALGRNNYLQILIFLICIPTLLYTAYYTSKTFSLSELLWQAEEEKNKILIAQNVKLESMVADRTREIVTQNEEITAQSEELAAHRDALAFQNQQLHQAQKIIEKQNEEIQLKNKQLEMDVNNRTQELEDANHQLIEHNNQLEQFSFITAHNLRAPLARILGLANVMEIESSQDEKEKFMRMLVSSTRDLDQVIKDLNVILDIKKHKGNLVKVDLQKAFGRVLKILESECVETNAIVTGYFGEADKVDAVAPYVESILYNLISNAIKYRHPDRPPIIIIKTRREEGYICLSVSDNGLGIDLSLHQHNIFNLYKRFHLHMEGKGLGLYLVKTQITALGGRIEVQSAPNIGTTFHVYFKD